MFPMCIYYETHISIATFKSVDHSFIHPLVFIRQDLKIQLTGHSNNYNTYMSIAECTSVIKYVYTPENSHILTT